MHENDFTAYDKLLAIVLLVRHPPPGGYEKEICAGSAHIAGLVQGSDMIRMPSQKAGPSRAIWASPAKLTFERLWPESA